MIWKITKFANKRRAEIDYFQASFVVVKGAMLVAMIASQSQAVDWSIAALNGIPVLERPEVRFDENGTFSGNTGCNSFQGRAQLENGGLVINDPVATTRMACPGEALTRQDDTIVAFLNGRLFIEFDPVRDALRMKNGGTVLELIRAPNTVSMLPDLPQTHAGLERPTEEPPYLNSFGLADDMPIHAAPDTASETVGAAFSGQVLRNDRCEGDWCRVATLDGGVSGWGMRQFLQPSVSALRAGQGVFDAVGPVPCAIGVGAPMAVCAMGVARDGEGSATVVVTKLDGLPRVLFFTDGAFVSSDTSEAGGGFETDAVREGDLTRITVDDERYEIPDAVIFGG